MERNYTGRGGGDGGGGADGGPTLGYGDMKANNTFMHRPGPPLTAIDRFLWSQHSHFLHQQNQNASKYNGGSVWTAGFGRFPCSDGGAPYKFLWPNSPQEVSLIDEFKASEDQNPNLMDSETPSLRLGEDIEVSRKNLKGMRKRINKKGPSDSNLIKGRWSEGEDRKLVSLVEQYGTSKWAQIAEKLGARAGKQCRERWHNHLRPDHIKKDSWSEEEDKILVEMHAKIGNHWAEIAKHIPGRTENAIKNRWNATKRRQNSGRKHKKPATSDGKPQSTILQDYIRSQNLSETATVSTPFAESTVSEDQGNYQFNLMLSDPSESVTEEQCDNIDDDELLYMQQLLSENQNHQNLLTECGFANSNLNTEKKYVHKNENIMASSVKHLGSDIYVSHLLNGATNSSTLCRDYYGYEDMKMDLQQLGEQGKKEMDLMELVSSHASSCGKGSKSDLSN